MTIFGDTKLFGYLGTLSFDYVLRFRGNTHVSATTGERRAAAEWVGKGGRASKLSGAALTASEYRVGAVVCVHAKDMKKPWCLASSSSAAPTAREIVDASARRWTIEPSYRVTKSPFDNYGWASLRIINPPIAIWIMASETSILAS